MNNKKQTCNVSAHQWLNNEILITGTEKLTRPCHTCGYCPYGQLVEAYPIKK